MAKKNISTILRHYHFAVYRQVLYWFALADSASFDPARAPVFIWQLPGDQGGIYGFPAVDGAAHGVKIATHNMDASTKPEQLNRVVSESEQQEFYERFVKSHLPTLASRCLKARVCTYTTTPDENFVIDYTDDAKSILLVSACSGHGFKHSAAVGKIAAECINNPHELARYPYFSLGRFA